MKPTTEQQAEAFRIRTLIGPVEGRADSILEYMADLIEDGEIDYDPETQILCFADNGSRIQIQPNGAFRKVA
jgi:hypothetical protein